MPHSGTAAASNGPRPDVLVKLEKVSNFKSWWKNAAIDEWKMDKVPKDYLWILPYFVGYSVVGTVLFVNFLPWT